MRHLTVEESAIQIRLPAQPVIHCNVGTHFPVVLRVEADIIPLLVVMRDVELLERAERAGNEVGHGVSRERPAESKQSVAINAKRGRLHGADVVRAELHLVRPFDEAIVVAELVSGGVDQTRRGEPARALKIAANVDVGIMRQRRGDVLNADVGGRNDGYLKLGDSVPIERGVEGVESARAEYVGVAKNQRI